jgi:poly(3-hydroxybutyrate) depolymerase
MCMKRLVAAAMLLTLSFVTPVALAAAPCTGCRLAMPEGDDKAPLIVALHGDHQPVATIHDAWTRLALKKGFGVLTLQCPRALGCKGSFWQWDGDPSWVTEQVAKVERADRDRLFLVGWSGGATYIGWHAQVLERSFAAIVIHGGGAPPSDSACADPKRPVYFLVGDKNPLHGLAVRLRDHFGACNSEITWDLVRGADHEAEWRALGEHGTTIVEWLARR